VFYILILMEAIMDPFGNVTSNPNDAGGMLGKAGDPANPEVHAKIDKVSDIARSTVDTLAAGAHQGFDKAAAAAGQAATTLDTKREELKVAQAKLMENTRNYVRKNPVASIGIATAIGYVVSRLLRSRQD
jgi:ElaB protein